MSDTAAYDLFISYSRRDNLDRRVSYFVALLRDSYQLPHLDRRVI